MNQPITDPTPLLPYSPPRPQGQTIEVMHVTEPCYRQHVTWWLIALTICAGGLVMLLALAVLAVVTR